MFVGHYSASIVAKAVSPKTPLWLLLVAAQLVDIFWTSFVLLGIEKVRLDFSLLSNPLDLYFMPFTHSLAATFFWAVIAYVLVRLIPRLNLTVKQSFIIAAVVASHWLLDLIVHRHDLLVFDDIKVGLGLWNYPIIALIVEVMLVAASVIFLCTKSSFSYLYKRRVIVFALVLVILQISSMFRAIPNTVSLLVMTSFSIYIGIAIVGYFMDRKVKF